jgi:hypothetical protein
MPFEEDGRERWQMAIDADSFAAWKNYPFGICEEMILDRDRCLLGLFVNKFDVLNPSIGLRADVVWGLKAVYEIHPFAFRS